MIKKVNLLLKELKEFLIEGNPYFLDRKSKKLINKVVKNLKEKYQFDRTNRTILKKIGSDYQTEIYNLLWVIVPASNRKSNPRYIILNPNFSYESNLTHELGHIILDTDSEREVNYFSIRLGYSYFKGSLNDVLDGFKEMIYIKKLYQMDKDKPKKDLEVIKKFTKNEKVLKTIDFLVEEFLESINHNS